MSNDMPSNTSLVPYDRQAALPDAITCLKNTQKRVGSGTQEKLVRTNPLKNMCAI